MINLREMQKYSKFIFNFVLELEMNPLKRKITEINKEPGPQKKRHNSGHKIGFDKTWQTNRQWLIFTDNSMNCSLCSEFQKKSAWATIGCKTVRLDKVKEHEEGSEHLNSVVLKLERELAKQFNDNMDKDSHKATTDALKVLFFMVKYNLPLDIFSSLVDLIIDVGSENLNKLNLAKNAKYTSHEIVAELLDLLSNEVRDQGFAEIRQSPTFSIMVMKLWM